ncbi:hypothetical protein ACEUBW_06695 [Aeromonas veronii]|uniref:hypothetical protein n=1 Tax=Aeromonas veronii TaxID=654 RepID=UPI001D08DF07|nr:hypothetical protein [Aeromonas veronii]
MKEKLEVLEKFLLVTTLVVGLAASGWKGAEYISAQSSIVKAKAIQEQEVGTAQQLLTKTYSDLLAKLDVDIREIDKKLEDESFKGTLGWDKLFSIRQSKVTDRNQLLTLLGSQVTEMKVQTTYKNKE